MASLSSLLVLVAAVSAASIGNEPFALPPIHELYLKSGRGPRSISQINARLGLYQGDLVGDYGRHHRSINVAAKKWPLGTTISYFFSASYSIPLPLLLLPMESAADEQKANIRAAFALWTASSCLTFQENAPATPGVPSISIVRGGGCMSGIGMSSSSIQPVSLDDGCEFTPTAAHEIGHALGLEHTQSRADRDSYVRINVANIDAEFSSNFVKMDSADNNNYGIKYDYGSVMHYDAHSFSTSDFTTIDALDSRYQAAMGQRERLAISDIALINVRYQCKENKCTGITATCLNGGIVDSRNCGRCLCPYEVRGEGPPLQYTGDNCGTLHPGRGYDAGKRYCGGKLMASATPTTFNVTIGQAYAVTASECYFEITAPAGKIIEIIPSHLKFYGIKTDPDCIYQGVDFFFNGPQYGGAK